jgi:sulfur carrier protein ThiS
LRKHIAVFVDGKMVADREGLSDPVNQDSEIYIMQALSGG